MNRDNRPNSLAADYHTRQSTTQESVNTLSTYSPRDAVWDTHKGENQAVRYIYAKAAEFERLAARMRDCAGLLLFGQSIDTETGEMGLKLRSARFCRVRHCPVCQWRRSLMWQARFYQALPAIARRHEGARWIFLTLTVRNCEIDQLAATVKDMNEAWRRLVLRKQFSRVLGWVRTTEVTRGKGGDAHPHFHALLMVEPSMLSGRNYVKHADWVKVWQSCLRVNYAPNVDVRAVKQPKQGQDVADILGGAVAEVLKYSVKPADMTTDADWFLELTRQTHRKRFVATGGALKDVLRLDEETDDDLTTLEGDGGEDDSPKLAFGWKPAAKQYRRAPKRDVD